MEFSVIAAMLASTVAGGVGAQARRGGSLGLFVIAREQSNIS